MDTSIYLEPADTFARADLIELIPQLRAFAHSLCRDRTEADDITQETLASAWGRRDLFAPGTNLKAWTFTILRNRFYAERRRSWRVSQLDPKVAEETLEAVSSPTGALELDDVRRAMLELPDEQREALILIGVAGLPYSDAAVICGCPEGTIKSRVSRARQALAAILDRPRLKGDSGVPGGAMARMLAEAAQLQARAAA